MDQTLFLQLFAALFAILSPVANLPVFLSLTSDHTAGEQRQIALTVIAGVIIGSIAIALTGEAMLNVFGIGIDDFRLAGGFLILLIALKLVSGTDSAIQRGTAEEKVHQATRHNPAIYPLTVPILLGPGTISTMIIFRAEATDVAGYVAYAAAVGLAIAILAATFLAAPVLGRLLGQTAVSVMSRLMGMILAAIALNMMVSSLKILMPGLAG